MQITTNTIESDNPNVSTDGLGNIYINCTMNGSDNTIQFYNSNRSEHNEFTIINNNSNQIFVAKIIDNTAPIVGQLYSDSENGIKTYVCFPDNEVEMRDGLIAGQNYYLDKDNNITEESFFNTFYGTAVSTNKLILYKK